MGQNGLEHADTDPAPPLFAEEPPEDARIREKVEHDIATWGPQREEDDERLDYVLTERGELAASLGWAGR